MHYMKKLEFPETLFSTIIIEQVRWIKKKKLLVRIVFKELAF